MLNKKYYTACYCPKNKDASLPENWIRQHYVLEYPEGVEPEYPSDADLETIVSKTLLADTNLTNEAIAVYLRLQLLEYFKHKWYEIYQYGEEQAIYNALILLYNEGYIKAWEEDDKTFVKTVNI